MTINVALLVGCITIISSTLGAIWGAAQYKHNLDVRIAQNSEAIKRLRVDIKFAYKNLETSQKALELDIFDVQNFLVKTTVFQLRGRAEHSSNSGADFLEE
ncbi:hypothetical protein [Microcoleus sp. FACHB-68]|uniref:hypothetical protein n=1 Tax=Microcoleus sp. FACHB-68 TaxID=2692826 RepID=UPI0016845725|nr:hypothetical protein [Microcoleus sp. FACHB-68]MBD1939090.1 hypothetical protein [Microcoleus sp. FACHB-68]